MSEWFKEHDWKSCVRLKRTGGSNPLLCAKKKGYALWHIFFLLSYDFEEDLWGEPRTGVSVLPYKASLPLSSQAKWTIDNCPVGRAAKGENPLLCAKRPILGRFLFSIIPLDPLLDPLPYKTKHSPAPQASGHERSFSIQAFF